MHDEAQDEEALAGGAEEPPPEAGEPVQEIRFRVSECVYRWTAAYAQQGTTITVRIRLVPDDGISAATMADLRTRWQQGIEQKWSNQFACCERPDCSGRRPLVFKVKWVERGEHHSVRVQRGPGRSNMAVWDTEDSGDVASHEFGHMLGHPDEYADPSCPGRNPVNSGTVMHDNSEVVARLVKPFCDRLGMETTQ